MGRYAIARQYSECFKSTIEYVVFLYLDLDMIQADLLEEVGDGELVDTGVEEEEGHKNKEKF